jgi:hypothetical protein
MWFLRFSPFAGKFRKPPSGFDGTGKQPPCRIVTCVFYYILSSNYTKVVAARHPSRYHLHTRICAFGASRENDPDPCTYRRWPCRYVRFCPCNAVVVDVLGVGFRVQSPFLLSDLFVPAFRVLGGQAWDDGRETWHP